MKQPLLVLCLLVSTTVAAQVREPVEPSSDYIVGAKDVLNITVFDEPQLTGKYRVDNEGAFTFPMVGRVEASGRRLREIETTLGKQLSDGYIKNPQITVEVEQYRSQSIFVIGEVRAPGKYALTGNMSLIEALAQAGSLSATASSEVLILRPKDGAVGAPLSPTDDGRADVTRVDLKELQSGQLSQNIAIQDGDTVFVPKADTLFITGYVRNPGSYVIERGMTVLQALSLAGGITERGSNKRIKILRIVNGKEQEIGAKLTDRIEPGDTIQVLQRFF